VDAKSPSTQAMPASTGAVLSIRLFAAAGDPSGELVWKSTAAVASVTADLVEASGGSGVVREGNLLVSKFSSIPSAILAAKRIQWAVSGCAETGADSGSAAILIHSVADPSSQAAPTPSLDQASPGQILLAEATCQSLQGLPGLPLVPSAAGLRELQWRSAGNASSAAQDDQALASLIGQHGLEDPAPAVPEEVAAPAPMTLATPPAPDRTSTWRPVERAIAHEEEGWLARVGATPLWLKGVAAVVPLGIAAVLFFAISHGKPPAPVQQTQPAATVVPPVQSPVQQPPKPVPPVENSTTNPINPPHAAKPAKVVPSKSTESRPGTHPAGPEARSASPCTLNSGDISSVMSIAENRFQNRQYAEALRRYESVHACQPENSQASRGIDRARTALQLQGPSNH
jgi:hypothetical protein